MNDTALLHAVCTQVPDDLLLADDNLAVYITAVLDEINGRLLSMPQRQALLRLLTLAQRLQAVSKEE